MTFGVVLIVVLMIAGVPIWLALGSGAVFFNNVVLNVPGLNIPMTMFGSLDSFVLMAVPYFLLAGNIMAHCGPAKYLFDFVEKMVGHHKGGLAFTTVLTCMIYAAITGSSLATLSGVAAIAMPSMIKTKYDKRFISGLLSVACTLGPLIPPSVIMIIYGSLTMVNAGTLFISAIIPGLIVGLLMGLVALITGRKYQNMVLPKAPAKDRLVAFLKALPALLMPLLVLGGIYTGVFTPTEAAAFATVYGILISLFVYRTMNWENLKKALVETTKSTSMIFMLSGMALLMQSPLAVSGFPQKLAAFISEMGLSPMGLILVVTAIWLVLGMFLETMPIMLLTIPVFLPSFVAADMNLIWVNVVMTLSMCIAFVSPPFGLSLFVSSKICDVSVTDTIRGMIPFVIVLIIGLILVLLFPQLCLWLPNLMKLTM
ncbi:MAG: TRAP transporter large permease [Firmicutes bacterium]|nr:TRAP transporter large permease [Bacillota bacterium]